LGCARTQLCARPTHGKVPVPQPHWPPAFGPTPRRNTRTLAVLPDPRPLGSLPPVCARPQPGADPTACQDTRPSPQPTALQALLSHLWDDQNSPLPPGPAWLQLHVEQLEPCLSGTGTILVQDSHTHQPARNPAPCAELAPVLQASQITAPPGSRSATTRGFQACLRDTHRLDWTLKN
jgi:hypothetical protein